MIKKQQFLEALKVIKSSHNFLLHLHPGPDADSVGSALALFHYLDSINKSVTLISGDSPFPYNLSFIPGSEKITKANISDINLNDFDCFIVADSGDISQISKNTTVVFPKNQNVIVFDHHTSNKGYGKINLIDYDSPATCQIIYQFFEANKIKINSEIAACLIAGIYTDSGGFKYDHTSPETFLIASKLTKLYPNFSNLIFEIENNDSPSNLKMIGQLLKDIDVTNHLAIASVSNKDLKKLKLDNDVSVNGQIANMLKSVVGWDIGISLTEVEYHKVFASFRTRDSQKYDLGTIAKETGFGGGHRAAAGASFPYSITKTKNLIRQVIAKLYPEVL
ncbi:DHH family phosphoesterase [Patescibacteria group bacterium]|nr:DHH family phosphoesterase [Patescibacteria group bacterium]